MLVALGGMVEDHVEDHLDAGAVQRLDHVPEFVEHAPSASGRELYPGCGAKNATGE